MNQEDMAISPSENRSAAPSGSSPVPGLEQSPLPHIAAPAPDSELRATQALLDLIAARTDSDYVALQRHTCASGRVFYSANLHREQWVRAGNGDTVAKALNAAVEREARFHGQEAA